MRTTAIALRIRWRFTGEVVECACCGDSTRELRGRHKPISHRQGQLMFGARCPMWGDLLFRYGENLPPNRGGEP